MKLLIANGYVIDPATGVNAGRNLLIEDGHIVDVINKSEPVSEDAKLIDATGSSASSGSLAATRLT